MTINQFVILHHKAATSLCNDIQAAILAVCSAADSSVSGIFEGDFNLGLCIHVQYAHDLKRH